MLCFKGKITQHVVPAAGLEPARPTKPRDFKSLVSTIPPRGQILNVLFLLHFCEIPAINRQVCCLPNVYPL